MAEKNVETQNKPAFLRRTIRFLWGWTHHIFLSLFCALFLILLAGALYQTIATRSNTQKYPPPGTTLKREGRVLHYRVLGEGSPPVVFESGLFGYSLDWVAVQPEVAQWTKTLAYDRPGYGWSDPIDPPHTARVIAENLHSLLKDAGIQSPVILVGHSLGGLFIRYYAAAYPGEVAGMVLVDSTPDDISTYACLMEEQKRVEKIISWMIPAVRIAAPLGILRILDIPATIADLPEEIEPVSDANGLRTSAYSTVIQEWNAIPAIMEEVRSLPPQEPKPHWPLVVLSQGRLLADHQNEPSRSIEDQIAHAQQELQSRLTGLSSNSMHIIAEKSYHYIQFDEPEIVVRAIRAVVDSARDNPTKEIGEYYRNNSNINSNERSTIESTTRE